MLKIEPNTNKSIYSIEKTSLNNRIFLKWKSSGLSEFLVISSSSKEDLSITDSNKEQFIDAITQVKEELLKEHIVRDSENDTVYYLVTLDELKRDGGLQIKNMPMHYAVYGIEINQNDFILFFDPKANETNVYSMTVDVVIGDAPYYVEKRSLFRTNSQYSGFHRVTLSAPYPSLVGGILKYNVNGFSYPFPDEVVKNGGSFFVNADSNSTLRFESSNHGVIIK